MKANKIAADCCLRFPVDANGRGGCSERILLAFCCTSMAVNSGLNFVEERNRAYLFVRGILLLKNPKEDKNWSFKLLNLLDFTSKRKRMSVIVQDETGQILLLCKGADSIIFERLAKNGRRFEEATTKHLNDYGEAGLRTLALAYKKLEESEYISWNEEFTKAKTAIGGDREAMLERVSDMMEKDLILVGATAVEKVPQCIDKLAQAGLKIWVLTGDKIETAIDIG
ncbi:probable phospholipid-transporting ATPase 7 [Helianthus annuus]|uniref:probable phospholipid-transporting ATPase 7 n=1 Tax=Helianthus annuus TaxID=4232 RepID=UPI000B8F54AB|nr:probable phospholipid-transporting ATPase 7 [Helianthus annuus]